MQDEGVFDYNTVFRSSIALFTGGKVLITDRLHSSILAFLLHKPHVFIDQGSSTNINDDRIMGPELEPPIAANRYFITLGAPTAPAQPM